MNNEINTREYVCTYIDTWLKNNNISTNKFAKDLGLAACSVQRWRQGICAPDLNMFYKITEYMNISINELLGFNNINNFSNEQLQFIRDYESNESFRNLVNSYRDDKELRVALDTIINKIK